MCRRKLARESKRPAQGHIAKTQLGTDFREGCRTLYTTASLCSASRQHGQGQGHTKGQETVGVGNSTLSWSGQDCRGNPRRGLDVMELQL